MFYCKRLCGLGAVGGLVGEWPWKDRNGPVWPSIVTQFVTQEERLPTRPGARLASLDDDSSPARWPPAGSGILPAVTAVDLRWIGTCNRRDAEEALRILAEVLVQFDRGNLPITVRPRSSTQGGFMPPPDQHDSLVRWRQEVMIMLTRRGIFSNSQYFDRSGPARECFLIEAEEGLVRRAHELFQARVSGRPLSGVLTWDPMSSVPTPLTWLEEIPTEILREVRDILEAAAREFALGKASIRISPYPSEYEHHPPGIGQEERVKARRSEVAEMLVRRGVLQEQHGQYVGGPNSREEDRGDWLMIKADPAVVRAALDQLRDHLLDRDQYERLPASQRATFPTPKWVNLPPGSVTNYYGPTTIANVQSAGDHSTITVIVGQNDLNAVNDLVRELKKSIGKLGLENEDKQEVEAEIATIEAQVRSPKPKASIVKSALGGIAKVLAGAAAHEAAGPLIHKAHEILSRWRS